MLPQPEIWHELNKQVHVELMLQDTAQVALSPNIYLALSEVVTGLKNLFPLKTQIVIPIDQSPYFDRLSVEASKSGLEVIKIKSELLNEQKKLEELLAKISKNGLAILTVRDDLITGQYYDWSLLSQALNDKKLFHIELSHVAHLVDAMIQTPSVFQIKLLEVNDRAIVAMGQRAKIEFPLSSMASWENLKLNDFRLVKLIQKKDFILDRENSGLPQSRRFFSSEVNRIWDRVVLYWDNIDASAIIEYLKHPVGVNTTSLCHWKHQVNFEWLKHQGHSLESLRGLLIIDVNRFDNSQWPSITSAVNEVMKLS